MPSDPNDIDSGVADYQRWLMERKARSMMGARPQTPLSGSAMMGGPSPVQEEQAFQAGSQGAVTPGQIAEGAVPRPSDNAQEAAKLAFEVGLGITGAAVGGLGPSIVAAPRAIAGATRLAKGAELVGRAVGAGTGQLIGSELMAPEGEIPENTRSRRTWSFVSGAMGELGVPLIMAAGKGAGSAVGKARARLFGRKAPHVPSELESGAIEAQQLLLSRGATLTPGQGVRKWFIDTLENIAEASFFGGGRVVRTRQQGVLAAMEALNEATPKMVANLGPDEMGVLLSKAIENSADVQRAMTRTAYKDVDIAIQQAGGYIGVDLRSTLQMARDEIGEAAIGGDRSARGMLAIINHFEKDPIVSFQQADKLRSTMLSIARADDDLVPGIQKYAGKIAHYIDESMKASGRQAGPLGVEVVSRLEIARALSRFGKETFNDPLLARLMGKAAPEQITRALFQGDNPTAVKRIMDILDNPDYRQAIGDPEGLKRTIQGTYLRGVRQKAGEMLHGEIDPEALRKMIGKAGGTFNQLFRNPQERKAIETSIRALELASKGASKGRSGAIFIQLSQAGALASAAERTILGIGPAGDTRERAEGVILLGPAALALALTNRHVASFLLRRAMLAGANAGKTRSSALAQLVGTMMRERIPFTFQQNDGQEYVFDPKPGDEPKMTPQKPVSKLQLQ